MNTQPRQAVAGFSRANVGSSSTGFNAVTFSSPPTQEVAKQGQRIEYHFPSAQVGTIYCNSYNGNPGKYDVSMSFNFKSDFPDLCGCSEAATIASSKKWVEFVPSPHRSPDSFTNRGQGHQ